MWAKEPTTGAKVSMVTTKVTTTKVLMVRLVDSRYALQGSNMLRMQSEAK